MAIYTGNVNRVTGLSGIDTESMIDKMMKAESAKYNRLQKDQIWLTWRQDAYREIIKNMQDFQNKWFNSTNSSNHIGFETAWNNYSFSVKDKTGKDSSAITINSSSQAGKYEIEVTQIAQTESLTGKPVVKGEVITGATADEIYKNIESAGEINLKFELDGETKEIKITKQELSGQSGQDNAEKVTNLFNSKLQEQFKGKVSLEKTSDGKLKFSASATSSLTITEGSNKIQNTSLTHTDALNSEKEGTYNLKVKVGEKTYTISTEFAKGESADTRINKIVNSFKSAKTDTGETVDISKDISIKLSKDGNNLKIENLSSTDEYEISATFEPKNESADITDLNATKINTGSNLDKLGFSGKVSTSITENSDLAQVLGEEWKNMFNNDAPGYNKEDGTISLNLGGKEIKLHEGETIKSLCSKIQAADSSVKLSFNQVTGRFKLESSKSGADNTINIEADSNEANFFKKLGIDVTTKNNNDSYIQGQNAKFKIDGIEVERSSNEVDMNGLRFTINGITENGPVTIESKNDEKATFDKLKEFVEDYNKLVEGIEKQIYQQREKSGKYGYYEPLLPEEKEAMSEDEIKKWEEKAKLGTLYKDDILTGILSELRNIPYKQIDIGGKTISLAEIGISHSSQYNSGKLEINEQKLKESISKRGDEIASLFTTAKTGVADQIKTVLDNAIGTKGTLRNKAGIKDTASVKNNMLSKQIEDIAKRMAEEKERLYQKEMYYFNMFAQMESAMNQQNAQMGMLLNMLGQN